VRAAEALLAALLCGVLALGATGAAHAADDSALDSDGDGRETKLWIVMIDGEAYLRTNDSRWLANLRRMPLATLRVDDELYPVVGQIMSDPELVEHVDRASREKYGWQEKFIHVFRMNEPTIVRLRRTRQPGVLRDAGSPI